MKINDLSQNTIASLFFSVVMLFIVAFDNGVPSFDELKEVSGTLEWFKAKGKNRSTLRFKLKEHEEMFVYHSISGSISAVKSALIKEGTTLKVLYDPNDSNSALWEFQTIHANVIPHNTLLIIMWLFINSILALWTHLNA